MKFDDLEKITEKLYKPEPKQDIHTLLQQEADKRAKAHHDALMQAMFGSPGKSVSFASYVYVNEERERVKKREEYTKYTYEILENNKFEIEDLIIDELEGFRCVEGKLSVEHEQVYVGYVDFEAMVTPDFKHVKVKECYTHTSYSLVHSDEFIPYIEDWIKKNRIKIITGVIK